MDDDASPDRTTTPHRRVLVWTLVVVASLIGFGSLLTTWVDRQMLDTAAWEDASAQLIADPEVRASVSTFLVDELYDNVDVAATLEERLPNNLKPLSGTLAGALRQPATDAVDRLLDTPRAQALWVRATSGAQQRLVNVLENKTGFGIATGDGVVTVDLGELLTSLGSALGISSATLDKIPAGAGQITVMTSDRLKTAQNAVRATRVLSPLLLALVLGMYALAIYLARGARRETLRNVGWAFVIVGLATLVVRRLGGSYAVDALADPSAEASAHRTWLIGTSLLGQIGWAVIAYGLVIIAGAWLAGPHAWAVALRARVAPTLNDRPATAWAAVAAAYLALVAWGPTHALHTAWGILLLGGLIAAGIVALRQQTLRERSRVDHDGAPLPVRTAGAAAGTPGA